MVSICTRLCRIKDDPAELIDPEVVERACREAKHRWRERTLDPLSTLRAFAIQVLHGNTAIAHVVRLAGCEFSESAYCQARARLPVSILRAVFDDFTTRARDARAPGQGLWCGHRTVLIDGSGVSTPDTPELRKTLGVSHSCRGGGGLPQAHVMATFDAHEGLLLDLQAFPVHDQDMRHAHELHPSLRPGDVLVGDRAFASYVHLHRLMAMGCHGVFRYASSWHIPFPAKSGERTRHSYNRHRRHEPTLVELVDKDDQVIELLKPHNRPKHMTPEEFAQGPSRMNVRTVRYKVVGKGLRSREVTLVTTLVDAKKYPAKALADLYLARWRIEVNLRHLKRTMGMDRLKCQSVDGVTRELLMYGLIYNAVCQVRATAARVAGIDPARMSFVDTLRAMLTARSDDPHAPQVPIKLKIWPNRPLRVHPRQLKRLHSDFKVMTWTRAKLIQWIQTHRGVTN